MTLKLFSKLRVIDGLVKNVLWTPSPLTQSRALPVGLVLKLCAMPAEACHTLKITLRPVCGAIIPAIKSVSRVNLAAPNAAPR